MTWDYVDKEQLKRNLQELCLETLQRIIGRYENGDARFVNTSEARGVMAYHNAIMKSMSEEEEER